MLSLFRRTPRRHTQKYCLIWALFPVMLTHKINHLAYPSPTFYFFPLFQLIAYPIFFPLLKLETWQLVTWCFSLSMRIFSPQCFLPFTSTTFLSSGSSFLCLLVLLCWHSCLADLPATSIFIFLSFHHSPQKTPFKMWVWPYHSPFSKSLCPLQCKGLLFHQST